MNDIVYSTPEQQIEKLKSQNLIIDDEQEAKEFLELFGYSNLIKSYRDPYLVISNGKKIYRSGTTFLQIVSLYLLDKNLRTAVMSTMLNFEEHLKEAAADVIARSFGTHPDTYLAYNNYANKRKSKYRFSLAGVLETMRNTLNTDKDPIHHYQTVHGIVPPWILFKSVYFSTIVNYIAQFKNNEKNALIDKIYDISDMNIDYTAAHKLLSDSLYICMDYRNLAAHGGRIYNYNSPHIFREEEIFGETSQLPSNGFGLLLRVLRLLKQNVSSPHLNDVLASEVTRHCNMYPQDITYLGNILNVSFVSHHIVHISSRSKIFHMDPHCSGIKESFSLDVEDAVKQGYIPCKRCIKL